ncbi:hypothetical protein [Actinacidiphila glaucinigra]|uniref:hypothetical protein n=1 Tax=Actinacidiphila glaucinigra TaxID=235986 RepID=UPI00371E4367
MKQEAKSLYGDWQNPYVKVAFSEYAESRFKDRDYATTSEQNGSAMNLHILPTFRAEPLRDITTPQVRRWRTTLLGRGVDGATVAKAYQILRAIMNAALDDGLVQRNPCRIKGGATTPNAERPFLSGAEVFRLADAGPARYRVMILVASLPRCASENLRSRRHHYVDSRMRSRVRRPIALIVGLLST